MKRDLHFKWMNRFKLLVLFSIVFEVAIAQPKSNKIAPDLLSLNKQPVKALKSLKSSRQTPITYYNLTQITDDSYVVLDAIANGDAENLLLDLKKLGLKEGTSYGGMVSGLLPISVIPSLEGVNSLKYAMPSYKPLTVTGKANSYGDYSMRTDKVRNKYGVTGKGLTIGVLSDSYNNRRGADSSILADELPGRGNPNGYTDPVNVLLDYKKGGTDEGRAMMEIIHDVAPGAKLAFHTANNGMASFANGIVNLANAGCQIIVDDVFYFTEPFYQDGIIAQAIDNVTNNNGAMYYSAAGNYDRSAYESEFRDGGTHKLFDLGGNELGDYMFHDFDPGPGINNYQKVIFPPYGSMIYTFQWADPFSSACKNCPGAKSDLDLFLMLDKDTTSVVLMSANNNIGGNPYEILSATNNSSDTIVAYVLIGKYLGAAGPNPNPKLMKYVNLGDTYTDEYEGNSSTCYGHANAKEAVAVGAAFWAYTPAFGKNPPRVEYFSSVGGTPILYDKVGNELQAAEYRQKPLIVAPDGGNTSFFGQQINDGDRFPNFFGTSAAAPHAAAAAALIKQVAGTKDNNQYVKNLLTSTAIDMDDPYTPSFDKGFDYKTGFGLLQADKAFEQLIKDIGVKVLEISETCTVKPDSLRGWVINNPNPFNVAVTWELIGTSVKGSVVAKPGDNIVYAPTQQWYTLILISWPGAYGETIKKASYSQGLACAQPKSGLASKVPVQDLFVLTNMYPNPITDNLTIELINEKYNALVYKVYNLQGKQVATSNVSISEGFNRMNINLSTLSKGIYVLKVEAANGDLLKVSKIVKN